MSTTRVMVTALPWSLAPDATHHLSAFVTLKLAPEAADATLADFPAAVDWVATMRAGRWELLTDASVEPLPLTVVDGPGGPAGQADSRAWVACLPSDTPVAGFPAPVLSDKTWHSYPANRLSDHAVDLHLASLTSAPTGRPPVLTNPALGGVIDRLFRTSDHLQLIRRLAADRAGRAEETLARRTAEASASLGLSTRRDGPPYPTSDASQPSALELLFRDERMDERITTMLDGELGKDHSADPETGLLADAHATRRYYDRPEEQDANRQPQPTDGATEPRTARPAPPDVHQRIGSFGSTPALLRRIGLVVDLALDRPDGVAALAGASWVAIRFVPADGVDVTRQAPPRTRVVVAGDRFDAVSSDAWETGAVPLGEDGYVVLDLDPDASGLKLDQHLRGLPRAAAAEANGDAVASSPATLRTNGFGIARSDRVTALRSRTARAESLETPDDAEGVVGPDLTYDDLVRGVRLEVWDDATKVWHSLHERTVTVTTVGGDTVLSDVDDTGFLQLSALNRVPGDPDNPYYLHEVIAGWDGWSLSAPRPGKVIVHRPDGSEEVVDAPDDDPVTGVAVHPRVRRGSLPRLRWGTSYSFRLVGVDLAGGSVLRPPDPGPGEAPAPEAVAAARTRLERLSAVYAARDARGLLTAVRDRVRAALPAAATDAADGDLVGWGGGAKLATTATGGTTGRTTRAAKAAAPRRRGAVTTRATATSRASAATRASVTSAEARTLPDAVRTGRAEIDTFLEQRVQAGAVSTATTTALAFAQVAEATATLLDAAGPTGSWRVRPQLHVDPSVFAGILGVGGAAGADTPAIATTPRPYLRWAPVPPPTLVARTPLTTGEQLSRLVIRSGLEAGSPDLVPTAERHVVPPKTTQLDAETAGCFDDAIGGDDAARQKASYAIALAERGTLLDEVIPSLEDATQTRLQPGMSLVSRPAADPSTAVALADITAERDTPLGEGQYVVHDVDDLVLPYLPDPHAAGVALVFYDAGAPHAFVDPRPLQSVVLPFPDEDDWPRVQPLRLVVTGGTELGASLDGRVVTVTLPPGEQVRVAMSSSLRRADLDDFGLWRSQLASTIDADGDGTATVAEVVAAEVLMRAAANGWTWWLSPSVDLRLVHAVPAPARVPQLLSLTTLPRSPGLTVAVIAGVADLHGASTERLVVRATWTEWVDDPATPAPVQVTRQDVVVDSPVGGTEHWGLLWMLDFQPWGPAATMRALEDGNIGIHRAIATFPDTHARTLSCVPSGATRYAEFFVPDDVPAVDDPTVSGDAVSVTVPSSARPAAPEVVDTVPLLRWEEGTEPDHPFAYRRVRRSGVRVWLRRPWFSSGDGELLGVVVARGDQPAGSVSQWGRDPVYDSAVVANASAPPLLEGAHLLLQAVRGTAVPRTARPVLPVAAVALADVAGTPLASVFGYRPEFHPARGEWFVDVALDDAPVIWPFLRLAVARYQPTSIDGAALSPVALTSWVQPLPTRTTTVSRPDAGHVRVTVSGAVAFLRTPDRGHGVAGGPAEDIPGDELDGDTPTGVLLAVDAVVGATRVVTATLQRLPAGATDLQWESLGTKRLRVVGVVPQTFQVTWSGELPLDRPLEPRTPGAPSSLRVLVEEQELFDADAPDPTDTGMPPVQVPRTVYLDTIFL